MLYIPSQYMHFCVTPKRDKKSCKGDLSAGTRRVAGEASRAVTHKSAAKSQGALGLPSRAARAFLLTIFHKWRACFNLRHRQKTHGRYYNNSLYESPFTIYVQ